MMKPFLTEEEAKEAKARLKEEMEVIDPTSENKEYTSLEINWREDCKDWEDAKIAAYGEMSRP